MPTHASIATGCAAAASLLLAGCGVPHLRVDTPEDRSPIYLDGRLAGRGSVDVQAPYYGRVEVTVAPTPEDPPWTRAARAFVAVDEPATPWIFPADLPVEAIRTLVQGPVSVRARLAPRRGPAPVEGVVPAEVLELRRRAREAALER